MGSCHFGTLSGHIFFESVQVIHASNCAIHPNARDEDQRVLFNTIDRHHNNYVGGTICNQVTYIRELVEETEGSEVVTTGYSVFREPGADCCIKPDPTKSWDPDFEQPMIQLYN